MSALSPTASVPRTDWFGDAPRDCDSVRARLHEYVDDELDLHVPTERAIVLAVANHVANCEQCARVEAQLRAMHLAVAAVGARMRVTEHPRLPSLKAELAIVQRVTAEAVSQRTLAEAQTKSPAPTHPARPDGQANRQPEPTRERPRLTLLSREGPREVTREVSREVSREMTREPGAPRRD